MYSKVSMPLPPVCMRVLASQKGTPPNVAARKDLSDGVGQNPEKQIAPALPVRV
jgi:hypothetical protein